MFGTGSVCVVSGDMVPSLHFSGPGHTCYPCPLFRVLSSSLPDKVFITVSGIVAINLGGTLESSGYI